MAFERYITPKGRLFIVLRRRHAVVEMNGNLHTSPTTVEVLDVVAEQIVEKTHVEFETTVAEGKLIRVTN